MPGVGDQRRGVDPLAYRELVPGHHLVTDDAEHGPSDPRSDVGGAAVLEQLANALESGERGAGPDDHGDADPGQVLGPLQPVRILLRGRAGGTAGSPGTPPRWWTRPTDCGSHLPATRPSR